MKDKLQDLPSHLEFEDTASPNRRALALARALGRYQALRDMAATCDAVDAENRTADQRTVSAAFGTTRVLDLYSMAMPVGVLPGFFGRMPAAAGTSAFPFRR
ncbi:hypothetical protein PMNALOAF_3532 [Methylobacterium adhaesivum]|nr:hypothetical protein PMNALOAF_3532 [Methylobacterium adhaesivum]